MSIDYQGQFEAALAVALEAHRFQKDKAGLPYILHPLHVMQEMLPDLRLAVVAVLHDVVEDSVITFDDLRHMGIDDDIISIVDLLTHREGQPYEEYIEGVAGSCDAAAVKIADLKHNLDLSRLPYLPAPGSSVIVKRPKYIAALRRLKRVAMSVRGES